MKSLKEIRISRGLTQAELAKKIGSTQAIISGHEKGGNPTADLLVKLCKALKCTVLISSRGVFFAEKEIAHDLMKII